ncbi:TPA: hypothetical protein SHR12_001833 [Campylobacter jejuni]|nr:hypothetical protein [Campylobacter jejuni]EAK7779362.1 hypothetical protein [Campylobacter jejuni]ECP5173292.1 hypothetical protein [Campylobacter jejuni]ECP9179149.1 hypothetical protein [Campylobacter jejuni]ECR2284862.1 hypothetical protein [Campylobacter jejuni]
MFFAGGDYEPFIYGLSLIAYYFLPLYCLTLLLYKYKPQYVNLTLHIGASVLLYLAMWVIFVDTTIISLFEIFQMFLIPIILQIIHLTFILYAIIYTYFDMQKISFTKRLGRYIVSFFIGIGLLILSFVMMYAIGYYISSWCDRYYLKIDERNEAIRTITFYVLIVVFPSIIALLLSHILYKNHKSFFTKILYRILSMIGKDKP